MSLIRGAYPSDVSDDEWVLVTPSLALVREDAGQRASADPADPPQLLRRRTSLSCAPASVCFRESSWCPLLAQSGG